MKNEKKLNRRIFLSKSFKLVVGASAAILATKITAYSTELGEDSTDVNSLLGGSPAYVPPPPHSSHSSRSWR
jgi:hypothetical protein